RAAPPPRSSASPDQSPRSGLGQGAQQPVKGSNAFLIGGIATGVIALLLIGGGGLWWSMQHPQKDKTGASVGASEAAFAASAPAQPTAASASRAAAAAPAPAPQAVPTTPTVASAPPVVAPKPEPVVRKPSPATPAPTVPQRQAQPETFAPVAAPARPAAPAPAPQPTQAPAPVAEPVPHAAPPKPTGRVEALRAALAACQTKGNFFTQQICIQETRWKYCGAPLSPDPLWGKIPECPNSSSEQNNP
ncbi:MAG: hypothetical protein B7X36_04480, partial [Thiomonas sp. 14-64-326]